MKFVNLNVSKKNKKNLMGIVAVTGLMLILLVIFTIATQGTELALKVAQRFALTLIAGIVGGVFIWPLITGKKGKK